MNVDISFDRMRAFVERVDQVESAHLDRHGAYALIAVTPERLLCVQVGGEWPE